MSNPGVMYLTNKKLSNGASFRLEDNIGEAIHIHYGSEWRIDLTINEFLELEKVATESLDDLLGFTGFKCEYFDPFFLDMFSNELVNLKKVSFETIKLSDLLIQTIGVFKLPIIKKLNKSRVYKALDGSVDELNSYNQENYRDQTNLDRVYQMKEHLSKTSYPFENQYIVLFNNQNIIRDGQHRAAIMLHEYGDREIPIIRMQFKNNRNDLSMHPWVKMIFWWPPKRIFKNIKKIIKKIVYFLKRVYRKIKSFF